MMNYTVSSDIRRALASPGFHIAALGIVLAMALASLQSVFSALRESALLPNGFHAKLVLDALKSEWVTLALPALCALPYASSFVDDVKSGYIKQFLHRTSVSQYIRGKLIACALSGGLALAAGILPAWLISALIFTPMELAPAPDAAAEPYFAEILMKTAVFFFSGAFWSLTGFTLAALTMSRYMAYASPFIIYYVLIILHERYFEDFYVLYPKEWLNPSEAWPMGAWGAIVLLLLLGVGVGLLFTLSARRRLKNG